MKNKDLLYLSLYSILKFLVWLLPCFMLHFISKKIAKITFHLNKKHRKIIDVNLQICFSELSKEQREALALKIYENYASFGIDFIKNQNTNPKAVKQKVQIEDKDEAKVKELIASKRAIIFTTAHYGNWELISLAYAAYFGAVSIVGRALDSKAMDKIVSKNRTQFDIELIDKKGGIRKMLKALKEKRALGILTDQNASENESIELDFFGKKVYWLVGASVIAKKSEALIVPVFIYQDGYKKYKIKLFEAMDSRIHSSEELTKYQAKCCEEMIKFKPDEYFFFHKRFKSFHKHLYE